MDSDKQQRGVLCLVVDQEAKAVLLGERMTAPGIGLLVPPGGGLLAGEASIAAAGRELTEETGLRLTSLPEHVGHLELHRANDDFTFHHFYSAEIYVGTQFAGDLSTTSELVPQWYPIEQLPFDRMWPTDVCWLPHVICGNKVKLTIIEGQERQSTLAVIVAFSGQSERHRDK